MSLGKREKDLLANSAVIYVKLAHATAASLEKLGVPQMECDTAAVEAEAIVALIGGPPDLFNRFTPALRARAIRCVKLVILVAEQRKKGIELLLFDTSGLEEGEQELHKLAHKLEGGAVL